MKRTKTIDLTKPSKLRIDEETSAFHPSWGNTILMTAYDDGRTFVLTRDGRNLLLKRPLREVLSRFALDNDVPWYERQAIYDMTGARKGRGYIAGHHRLVPTHGTTNANVVYYMAHWLDEEGIAVHDHQLIVSFHGCKRIFRVRIDTSFKTFNRLLKVANEAATFQLDEIDWIRHNYGIDEIDKKESVRYYHNFRDHCQSVHHELQCARTTAIVRQVLTDYLGEEDCQEIMEKIERNAKK